MDLFSLLGAFIAGILSFFSPCILPLLPVYLSFITGYALEGGTEKRKNRWRTIFGTLCFGFGFSVVFILLGATATGIGRIFAEYQLVLTKISGAAVILLGLHVTGIIKIMPLYKEKRIRIKTERNAKHRFWQAFLMGFAFSFGWTPCITPVLAGILVLAAQQQSVYKGVILLAFYSAGLWLPFMTAALFTAPVMNILAKRPKIAVRATAAAGVFLIVMGVILLTGRMSGITSLFY
ncbi:MAG: cytochrome c biogenesis protein CcdA [Deferribacteraceae bacterium]|jgi:cytochrome c-type biogenesis protein|nr:cytochrome c biogenesis protein CcdA [Deferribacteraceae bacterium]